MFANTGVLANKYFSTSKEVVEQELTETLQMGIPVMLINMII